MQHFQHLDDIQLKISLALDLPSVVEGLTYFPQKSEAEAQGLPTLRSLCCYSYASIAGRTLP